MTISASAARRRAMLLVLSATAFIVLTTVAMALYNGGSRFDLDARHYQFFGNFFSDLGATTTYSRRFNPASRALFAVALITVGIAFAWSGPAWRTWAVRDKAILAASIARVVAVLTGLGFVGIAVMPPDTAPDVHIVLVQTAFALLLLFVGNLVVVQLRNNTPRPWVVANLVFLVLLVAYVAIVTGGPNLNTFAGLRLQIVAQKIAVYASILNLSLQAWGVTLQTKVLQLERDRPGVALDQVAQQFDAVNRACCRLASRSPLATTIDTAGVRAIRCAAQGAAATSPPA